MRYVSFKLKYPLPDIPVVPPREDLQDRAIKRFHVRGIGRGIQRISTLHGNGCPLFSVVPFPLLTIGMNNDNPLMWTAYLDCSRILVRPGRPPVA